MKKLFAPILALILILAFFLPYVIKLKSIDLLLVLFFGIGLVCYDFWLSHKES